MNALNSSQTERIAANRAAVHAQMPELVPVIGELHAIGLIDGWRDVVYVGPQRADPPSTVSGKDIVVESTHDRIREEMKRGRR